MMRWFYEILLGHKGSKTFGDNFRRGWSRVSLFIIFILILDFMCGGLIFWTQSVASFVVAVMLLVWGIAYFVLVVATIPFLTSHNFRPDAVRLMRDTATSITFSVLGFALLYLQLGIIHDSKVVYDARDALYFSAVTFSTLGYGDFSPVAGGRLIAAFQAILGNLHLGVTVGVMFFATQVAGNTEFSGEDIDESPADEDAER